MDLRRILVPTDFQEAAERAAELAALIANRARAQLVLLSVDDSAGFVDRSGSAWAYFAETRARIRDVESSAFEDRVRSWAASTMFMTEFGEPREVILQVADKIDADLVVISSRGEAATVGLGPTASRVLRGATRPTLIVPHDRAPGAKWRLDRILAPIDFQETAEAGLRATHDLARHLDMGLSACTVVVWPRGMGLLAAQENAAAIPELTANLADEATIALANFTQGIGMGHVPIHVVGGERPAEAIIECANNVGADMIVLPSLGKGTTARIMLGSTSERLAKISPVPVLVIPRPALRL